MIQAFGFTTDAAGESSEAIPLSAVSISMTPEALEAFAQFVAFAASEMRRLGPEQYDHMHFGDSCKQSWAEGWPDIQLTRVYDA
jgi:hypothetical protein